MVEDFEFYEFENSIFSEAEIRTYGKLLPSNPLRPVDWRFKLANFCLKQKAQKPQCDDGFEQVYSFVKKLNRALVEDGDKHLTKLVKDHSDLYSAWIIYSDSQFDRFRTELHSRILTREQPDQIIKKLGITTGIYDWYKIAFFDVEDRLENVGFIVNQVILGGSKFFDVESEEVLLPLLGYFLDVEAVDYCVYRLKRKDLTSFLTGLDQEIRDRLKLKLWTAIQGGDIERTETLVELYRKLTGQEEPQQNVNLVEVLSDLFGPKQ